MTHSYYLRSSMRSSISLEDFRLTKSTKVRNKHVRSIQKKTFIPFKHIWVTNSGGERIRLDIKPFNKPFENGFKKDWDISEKSTSHFPQKIMPKVTPIPRIDDPATKRLNNKSYFQGFKGLCKLFKV
jgi:hypothetical protein